MRLYYSPGACSFGAFVVLESLGRPFDLVRVPPAVRQTPAWRAIHPAGQVPALGTDDGRNIAENTAILLHLVDTCPDCPLGRVAGTPARDAMHFWLSWLDSGFHAAWGPVFSPQRFHPDPAQHDTLREAALTRIAADYAKLEAVLDARDTFLEDGPSVLEPYVYAMARWGRTRFDLGARFPAVAAFLAAQEATPALARMLALEQATGDTLPVAGHARSHTVFTA